MRQLLKMPFLLHYFFFPSIFKRENGKKGIFYVSLWLDLAKYVIFFWDLWFHESKILPFFLLTCNPVLSAKSFAIKKQHSCEQESELRKQLTQRWSAMNEGCWFLMKSIICDGSMSLLELSQAHAPYKKKPNPFFIRSWIITSDSDESWSANTGSEVNFADNSLSNAEKYL